MLPFNDYYNLIGEWRQKKQWSHVRASSAKRVEASGYVDLGIGSYWRWMQKGWFEKAKLLGVVAYKDGKWLPVGIERVEQIAKSQRGREIVYEEKRTLDFSKLNEFAKSYDAFIERSNASQMVLAERVDTSQVVMEL